jgi:hypothetical protein
MIGARTARRGTNRPGNEARRNLDFIRWSRIRRQAAPGADRAVGPGAGHAFGPDLRLHDASERRSSAAPVVPALGRERPRQAIEPDVGKDHLGSQKPSGQTHRSPYRRRPDARRWCAPAGDGLCGVRKWRALLRWKAALRMPRRGWWS